MMSCHNPKFAIVAIGLAVLAISGPVLRAETLARVNGAEITSDDFKIAMEDIGRTLPRQMQPDQRKAYVINYLIDMRLLSQKADQTNLANSALFKQKLAYFRQKALMESYMDEISKKPPSKEEIKAVYDKAMNGGKPQMEVNASHILVPTQKEAEAALKRVQNGEDFAKVAKEISKDPGSPGGDLGWFTKDRMVPPFAEMAFKTKAGTISPPVKSQFGWHIIKVKGQRPKEFPKLEEVQGQIQTFLARKNQQSAITTLRNSAKIEKLDPPK